MGCPRSETPLWRLTPQARCDISATDRALGTLLIDIDDIAFLITGSRDHFTRAESLISKTSEPAYRQATHGRTNLDGYAGLDKQLGRDPEGEKESGL